MISQISLSYIATSVVDEQKGINHMLSFGSNSGNLSQYLTEIELAVIIVLFLVSLLRDINDSSSRNSNSNTNTITITAKENDNVKQVW